jgi:two-component system phosphate regulon sensor histidine kinase PhoR/two-component system sensor histidine kinase VicK
MDYGKQLTRKLTVIVTVVMIVNIAAALYLWQLAHAIFSSDDLLAFLVWLVAMLAIGGGSVWLIVSCSFKPLSRLSDVIVYAGHSSRGGVPPNTEKLKIGKEMITALAHQVYDLSTMSGQSQTLSTPTTTQSATIQHTPATAVVPLAPTIIDHIALPVIGIDSSQTITVMNRTAAEYFSVAPTEAIGKPLYDIAKLSFESDETFETWLKYEQEHAVNGIRQWERVRSVNSNGEPTKQFDLVASYAKKDEGETETMIAIYDRTDHYMRDDQEISFVALTVHELRTPLTIMRGYIEVFEDEVGPTLSPELKGFMHKMQASAQQLTAFVGNILNVARVEENQLSLKLQEYNWPEILKGAIEDLALRAAVHGKHIEVNIAANIPSVAVDRISIHEVINNLVDNAIKYSENSDKIIISTGVNQDGMVETSVQDFGIGIPSAVMPDLFQKFYRSHKSRVQVGGTGLGLYLCKALITAHDGNIWVRSKEGEGSIFSFTIQPYDSVKHEQETGEDGIIRGAHGWIKNHSLNRQ